MLENTFDLFLIVYAAAVIAGLWLCVGELVIERVFDRVTTCRTDRAMSRVYFTWPRTRRSRRI